MSAQVTCPKCGSLRTGGAVQGLCPQCLGKLVLGKEEDDAFDSGWDRGVDLEAGFISERFGDYEIIERIAYGGMGVVFKARQVTLHRVVALKMIRSHRLARKTDILRFRAEAEAAAHLPHPGIVAIHEVGQVDGQHFYSMDYVEGKNLGDMIEDEPLPADRSARYIRDIARAIHYAHTRGIIHRDLKPSNVLIDPNDRPRVTDFGLAKVLQSDTGLTLSGTVMGSPSYMSPEQAKGRSEEVGVQTDVYALGAILYALLTGRPPFDGASTAETLRKVEETEPTPPRISNTRVPRDLETICLKCLDKVPAKRYSSAEHLAEELDRFLENEPIHARPIGAPERCWRWCRRKPALAAVTGTALLILAGGIAGVFWQWREAEFERKQGQQRLLRLNLSSGLRHVQERDLLGALPWLVEALALEQPGKSGEETARIRIGSVLDRAPRLLQLWVHDEMLTWADFSPEGKLVVIASRDGTARIYDSGTGELVAPPLQHGQAIFFAAFSSDARRVLTTCVDQTVQIWDATTGRKLGGPLRHAASKNQEFVHGAFSPDGRLVATTGGDKTTRLWDAETGREIIPAIHHAGAGNWVAFHPDGTRFVSTSGEEIWVRSTATGEALLPRMRHARTVTQVKYSPDGKRLVSAGRDQTALIWDAETGQRVGGALKHIYAVNWVEFSPDGRWVATSSYDRTARVWDALTGAAVTPWLRHAHSVVQVTFSPDGRYVLTSSHDHSARVWEIATAEPALSFKHNGFVVQSRFSPDGHRILTAGQDQVARLWDIAVDVPSLPPMHHGTNAIQAVAFSPAGDKIASAGQDGTARIWDAATGGELFRLTHDGPVNSLAFSSDGALLLTTSADQSARVWSMRDRTLLLPPLQHSGNVNCGTFSADGARIATGSDDGTARIWDAHTGKPLGPPLAHQGQVKCVALSPDGGKLATGGSDVRVWHGLTGEPISDWIKHEAEVRHLAFSPDGMKLATACVDAFDPYMYPRRSGQVWDANTGRPISPPLRHSDGVLFCTFTPDGKRVITTSEDGTAQIWDATTGALLTLPLRHSSHVFGAQVTRDGARVLTWGRDGTARIWDVFTGDAVIPPIRSAAQFLRAALSPDGSCVAIGAEDGQLRIWKLPREQRPVQQLASMAMLLTGQRLDPLSGPTALDTGTLQRAWKTLRVRYPEAFTSNPGRVLAWEPSQPH